MYACHAGLISVVTLIAATGHWRPSGPPPRMPEPYLWAWQPSPTPGPARVLGGGAGGCITGAVELPPKGVGFRAVRPGRPTHFGHPDLIDYIVKLGARVHAAGLPAMPVGDLSFPRGGPYPQMHRSHQTGLDADIYYWGDPPRPEVDLEDATEQPAGFSDHGVELSRGNVQQLKHAAEDPRVERILVGPRIKAALCRVVGEKDWLKKIQPFWGHEHHFHVRIHCPDDSPECERPAIPSDEDPGCGATLAWWFTPAARESYRQIKYFQFSGRGRNLPPACMALAGPVTPPTTRHRVPVPDLSRSSR